MPIAAANRAHGGNRPAMLKPMGMLEKTPPEARDAPPDRPKQRGRSRRAFLIGTGGVVGLAVGFALWPRQWPNARQVPQGDTLLNAWISIGPDGRVTVAIPQAEMGQGIHSGLAQIVADELGADWARVGVEPAPWHPAFAHVGLAAAGAAALPPMLQPIAEHLGATVIQRMNLHMTGGSTSVMGYHDILRDAAATARTLLAAAAAKQWDVPAATVDARNHQLVAQANAMPFAEAARLVDADANPGPIRLRDAAARPLEGKPLPRIDIPAKVDGSARFGGDVRVAGMVYAAIRHGPVGSRLVSATAPAGSTLVKGPDWVASTGATTWEAMRALEQVKADFAIDGESAGPDILAGAVRAAAFPAPPADAATISADYAVPFLAHAAMEPMVAAARLTDGQVEVWGPTQSLTLAHAAVADALGVPEAGVTIYPTLVGGGFGRKAEGDAMAQAALIARAIGKPVLLQWSREQDFAGDRFRPPAAAAMRATLGKDGTIASWEARIAVPNVGSSFMGRTMPRLAPKPDKPSASAIEGADTIPYAVGRFSAAHVPVLQPVPLGYWRSVGHSFSAFFVESFVDELAAEAGVDPLAFRLKLLDAHPRHARVLREAAAAGQWEAPVPAGFGRGIAVHGSFGSIVATVIEAAVIDGAIRIRRLASAIDCGRAINPGSVRAQLEGGAIMGLSAAIGEGLRFARGVPSASNFDAYPLLPMAGAPEEVVSVIVTSGEALGGVGEPGTPPAAPALANALYAATGRRARTLPLGPFFAGA